MTANALVAAINSALPPGAEDFDPATTAEVVLAAVADAPEVIDGRPAAVWVREQLLEAIRRSRRGKRLSLNRQRHARSRFEDTLERLRARRGQTPPAASSRPAAEA